MKNMNMELIYDDEFDLICKYIKLRNESNVSQSELARKVGIARSTIARMERNLHSISLSTFTKLLDAMNYKLEIMKTGLTPEDVAKTVKYAFDLPHEITIPSIEVRHINNY